MPRWVASYGETELEDMEDDDNFKAVALGVAAVELVTDQMMKHDQNPKEVATVLTSALAFHIDGFQTEETRNELMEICIRYIRRTVGRREQH